MVSPSGVCLVLLTAAPGSFGKSGGTGDGQTNATAAGVGQGGGDDGAGADVWGIGVVVGGGAACWSSPEQAVTARAAATATRRTRCMARG